ncbi:unnamed protein product [Blepharisma stoltei]|uniref:Vacuolar protein sorting-associated protein 8 central domain-containing protein n=1 Tax=Blepharisma stoltei TaxID=1481888 RepID=A0AAU9K265_9CILI|nr:unnamed protein product [Blepharisma stoltei]
MDSFDAQDELDLKEWKSFINDPDYIDSIVYEEDIEIEYNKFRGFKLTDYCMNKYSYNFTNDPIEDPQIDKDYINSLLQTEADLENSEKKKLILDQIEENFLQRFSKSDVKVTRFLSLKSQASESQQPILKLEELSQISSKIYTPVQNYYNSPTAISISKQYIIIGNAQGLLKVFNHEGKDIKQLVPDEQTSAQVTAIDISDDEQHAIAGYSNGYVGLWELKSGDCVKFAGTSHKSQILTIKFWKKGKLNAISCDAAGKINLIEFMKLFIATTINTRTMINGDLGVCTSIKILVPNVYIPHPTDAANVIAMTFLDKIMIFTIEPEFKLVYSIERPGWIFPEDLPYVAWKLGLCPNDNHIKGPILAVAWGKLVALYRVNALNKNEIEIAGSMKLDDCTNGIMWLSYDTIAVLSEENIYALNSKEFNFIEDKVVEQETKLKTRILNQKFIKNSDAVPISAYYNSYEAFDNAFHFLGEKGIYKGVLLDWIQVIENLKEKGEWIQLLSLCLEIYHGKRKKLFNLPFSKSDIKPYLEKVIAEYIELNFINYESKVNNSIEYCIEIDSLEYLFNISSNTEQSEYFYDIIGKYALAQEIKAIPREVFVKISEFYVKTGNLSVLESIIISLDPKTIDRDYAIEICKKFNFIDGLIFVCTNSTPLSFKKPLSYLYAQIYSQELPSAKRSLAYKIMWYAKRCFKGNSFPSGRMIHESWELSIIQTTKWLFSSDHLETLIRFNIDEMLSIIWILFEEAFPLEVLSHNQNVIPDQKQIIDELEKLFKQNTPDFHKFANFITKAITVNSLFVSKQICLKTAIYLLQLEQENYDSIDRKFVRPQDDGFLKRNSKLILKMLKNCDLDSENEIKQVLAISLKSPYDKVIAFLYELKRDFPHCLNIYLRSNTEHVRTHVFKWIVQVLKSLTEDELKEFKSAIFDNLYRLVQIDSPKTVKLTRELFQYEEIKLIQNLQKFPELQLKYLDGLVKLCQKEDLDPTHILKKYIYLMCKYRPEEVLLALKSRNDYPIDECLEICREFNVLDASAYLYEELGAIRESFDILLGFVKDKQQFLFEIVQKKEKILASYFVDLKKSIEETLNLCARNTDRLDKIDNEEHWFMLLKESLDIYAHFQDYFVLYPAFEPEIKEVIKEIVEKMSDSILFSSIMSYIIENYSNIPIKYFKETIIGVLSRLAYQKKIIRLAIDLQNRDTVQMSYKLLKLKNQGISSKDFNCSKCEEPIQSDEMMKRIDEKFLMFICGHAYHGKCIVKPICEKCDRDDFRKGDFNSKYSNKN